MAAKQEALNNLLKQQKDLQQVSLLCDVFQYILISILFIIHHDLCVLWYASGGVYGLLL